MKFMHAEQMHLRKQRTGPQGHASEAPNGAVQHTCNNALAFPQTLEGLMVTPSRSPKDRRSHVVVGVRSCRLFSRVCFRCCCVGDGVVAVAGLELGEALIHLSLFGGCGRLCW